MQIKQQNEQICYYRLLHLDIHWLWLKWNQISNSKFQMFCQIVMISCQEIPRTNSAVNHMPCAINYTFHLDLIGYLLHDLMS